MPLQVSIHHLALGRRRVHFGKHLGVPREDVARYPHSSSCLAGLFNPRYCRSSEHLPGRTSEWTKRPSPA